MSIPIAWMDSFITTSRIGSGRDFMRDPLNVAECARIERYWRDGFTPEQAAVAFVAPRDVHADALERTRRRFERDADSDDEITGVPA